MVKVPVYNLEGKEIEELSLDDKVFDVEFKNDLVHQITSSQINNERIYTAHTKTRGEVRGGGKKPWKQKGTGRARAGSIRNPIWRGGGITFGPRNERNYSKKINKKMGKLALKMVLSAKIKDKEVKLVDKLESNNAKTKAFASVLENLKTDNKSVLVVTAKKEDGIKKACKNLVKVDLISGASVNSLALLKHKYLLMEKEAIQALEQQLLK